MSWHAPHASCARRLDRIDNGLVASAAEYFQKDARVFARDRTLDCFSNPAPASAFPACKSRTATRYVRETPPEDRRFAAIGQSFGWFSTEAFGFDRQHQALTARFSPLMRTCRAPQTPCSHPTWVTVISVPAKSQRRGDMASTPRHRCVDVDDGGTMPTSVRARGGFGAMKLTGTHVDASTGLRGLHVRNQWRDRALVLMLAVQTQNASVETSKELSMAAKSPIFRRRFAHVRVAVRLLARREC